MNACCSTDKSRLVLAQYYRKNENIKPDIMKTRTFEVPVDIMVEFVEILEENSLDNTIQGTNEDDEIIIDVNYESDERQAVFELMELLDPEDED